MIPIKNLWYIRSNSKDAVLSAMFELSIKTLLCLTQELTQITLFALEFLFFGVCFGFEAQLYRPMAFADGYKKITKTNEPILVYNLFKLIKSTSVYLDRFFG